MKKAITGWTTYDWAISRSITKPTTLAGSFISHSAQYTGTAIFTSVDVIGDFGKKEYVGALLDFGSGVGGAVAGNLATRFIGSAIMAAFIPEAAVGVAGFALSVVVGVQIDKFTNWAKNYYYRRE